MHIRVSGGEAYSAVQRQRTGVPEASQNRVEPARGGGFLHMQFSRDAAISRIPAPHLLKQGQLQLAGIIRVTNTFSILSLYGW